MGDTERGLLVAIEVVVRRVRGPRWGEEFGVLVEAVAVAHHADRQAGSDPPPTLSGRKCFHLKGCLGALGQYVQHSDSHVGGYSDSHHAHPALVVASEFRLHIYSEGRD